MKRGRAFQCLQLVVSLVLTVSLYAGAGPARAEEPDYGAMYTVSNGTITGFQTSYLDSLTSEDGYQYTDIVIPEQINGVPITRIGDSAFLGSKKGYEAVRVRHIDLSAAVHLTRIEQYAFYALGSMYSAMEPCQLTLPEGLEYIGNNSFSGQSSLTGSLSIPDSVTTIENSAFMNCGFTGSLKLPDNPAYTQIKLQIFKGCSFSGTLVIPPAVTVLSAGGSFAFAENDFSEVVLTDQITSIGGSTFKDCQLLERVRVQGRDEAGRVITLPQGLTQMGSMIFQNCSNLAGAVALPDTLTEVGSEIFEGTGIQTVYMPNSGAVTYKSNFLFGTEVNAAVFASKELYDQYYAGFSSGSRKYFSYPLTVTFLDSEGGVIGSRDALYNRPLNYQETAEGWQVQEDFEFPPVSEETIGYDTGFSFQKGGKVAKPGDLVTESTLYFSKSLSVPTITFDQVPTKTYDGQTEYIRCEASHPLAGEDGPYTFLYCALKGNSDQFFYVSDEPFEYPVTDVKDSMQYVCYVQMYDKAHPEYRGKWSKSAWYDYFATWVRINPAEPVVNPSCAEAALTGTAVSDLPLTLSEGDTPGTIQWENGDAVIQTGDNLLTWSFTPEDTDNFRTDIGQTGQITVTGTDKMDVEDVEDGIGKLPEAVETEQDARSVLNVWRQYAALEETEQQELTEETKTKLLDTLKTVPGVEIQNETPGNAAAVDEAQQHRLLGCMTEEDARGLLDGTTERFVVAIRSEETRQISEEERQSMQAALGQYQAGAHHDITVEKRLYAKAGDESPAKIEAVKNLPLPVPIWIDIPDGLAAPNEQTVREYTVFRTHEEGGVWTTEPLEAAKQEGRLSVSSDRFSLYTLAYQDHVYAITADPGALNFGTSIVGYANGPEAQTVTIQNTGNETVRLRQPSAAHYEIGSLPALELAPGETASFTVRPKGGLGVNDYEEIIQVQTDQGAAVSVTAQFAVKQKTYQVTVRNGRGGGSYAPGETVTIQADAPAEGLRFQNWTVVQGKAALSGADQQMTTFIMPEGDVVVAANYIKGSGPATGDPMPAVWFAAAAALAGAGLIFLIKKKKGLSNEK